MSKIGQTELRRKTLEAIHDSAVDAIITITDQGIIETVNPATETLFGYPAEELIGANVNILMPSPYQAEHDGYLRNYLQSGMRKVIGIGREIVAKKKDGSVFPIHLAVSEVQLEGRRVFAGFIRDLTDLKTIEAQQATLGRIIEESLNEVFIFDADDMKFVQVNRGARENLGYSLEELHQLTPIDIKPDVDREKFEELYLAPLREQKLEQVNFITRHQRKDGSLYDVEVHLQLAVYKTKLVFVAIILDITEKLEAERVVQQQQENLKAELERLVESRTSELRQTQADLVRSEKFSTLGKVSGGIAHEIRNPLNAVKTSAYYLLNAKAPSEDKVKEHLERIDRQVSMIDNVITALSDVARMPDVDLRPVAMRPILREIGSSITFPSNVNLEIDLPDDLPKVLADETQIGIAFRNLIKNARDAMPDGGTIRITSELQDDALILSVTDQGTGISEEILETIFEPLFTTKARGMGLGLSITLAIVEKNQGKLMIDSEVGKGTKFSVSLKPNPVNTVSTN